MSESIVVNSSAKPAQIAAGLRQTALVIGGSLATLGLFPGVTEFLDKIASPEAAGALGFIGVVVSFVWGQIATHRNAKTLASAASDPANKHIVLK